MTADVAWIAVPLSMLNAGDRCKLKGSRTFIEFVAFLQMRVYKYTRRKGNRRTGIDVTCLQTIDGHSGLRAYPCNFEILALRIILSFICRHENSKTEFQDYASKEGSNTYIHYIAIHSTIRTELSITLSSIQAVLKVPIWQFRATNCCTVLYCNSVCKALYIAYRPAQTYKSRLHSHSIGTWNRFTVRLGILKHRYWTAGAVLISF